MASRTYYASQAVGLYPKGFLSTSANWSHGSAFNAGYGNATMEVLSGVQSVGFSSSVEFDGAALATVAASKAAFTTSTEG